MFFFLRKLQRLSDFGGNILHRM